MFVFRRYYGKLNNNQYYYNTEKGTKVMDEQKQKISWVGFVETTIVNFFQEHELEKLTVEDGKGNKAN
jgi:hypothetical protein